MSPMCLSIYIFYYTVVASLTYKLGAAPDKGQKLEVIQPPHTLASSWLHSVGSLQFPHH